MNRRLVVFTKLVLCVLSVSVCLVILGEGIAEAYIDPGAGNLMWQVLLGSLATAAYGIHRLRNFIRGKVPRVSSPSTDRPSGAPTSDDETPSHK